VSRYTRNGHDWAANPHPKLPRENTYLRATEPFDWRGWAVAAALWIPLFAIIALVCWICGGGQ
jgi:hypothetical protein